MISDCISSAPRMTSSILRIIQSNDLSLILYTRLLRQELAILKRNHNIVASIVPDGSNKKSEALIFLQKFCTTSILDQEHMPRVESDPLSRVTQLTYFDIIINQEILGSQCIWSQQAVKQTHKFYIT